MGVSANMFRQYAFILGFVLVPGFAQAYIGPGVGVGAIAAALGVLGAIALALFAVIYYPVKRLLKGRKSASRKVAGKVAGPGE